MNEVIDCKSFKMDLVLNGNGQNNESINLEKKLYPNHVKLKKYFAKPEFLNVFWEDSCVTRKQLIDQQKSTNRPTGVLLPLFSWLNWWPIMLSLKVIETLHSSQTWHQPPRSPIPWKNPTNGDLITRNKRNKYNFMGPYLHAPEYKTMNNNIEY